MVFPREQVVSYVGFMALWEVATVTVEGIATLLRHGWEFPQKGVPRFGMACNASSKDA